MATHAASANRAATAGEVPGSDTVTLPVAVATRTATCTPSFRSTASTVATGNGMMPTIRCSSMSTRPTGLRADVCENLLASGAEGLVAQPLLLSVIGKLAGPSPRPPQLNVHARPPQPTRFGMHGVGDRR